MILRCRVNSWQWVQPPDAENRMSGGVGGVTGFARYLDPIKPGISFVGWVGRVGRIRAQLVIRQRGAGQIIS
jgi:hypothetical protein